MYHQPDLSDIDLQKDSEEEIVHRIVARIDREIQDKIDAVGVKPFNDFIRYNYLRQIDQRWQDHLDELEALREAVYLRTYGQKNPLLEYKLEGFDIFDTLIYNIRTNIARMVINVEIREPERPRQRSTVTADRTASHQQLGQFAAGGAPKASSAGAGSAQPGGAVQVKRTVPKVGRNDPCPCGSGKKYKHGHGK